MYIRLLLFIGMALSFLGAQAQERTAKDTFDKANVEFVEGKTQASLDLYLGLIASGHQSNALLVNTANAYLKSSDHGRAILFYERALRNEQSADLLHNLHQAQERIEDPIPSFENFFLTRWWDQLMHVLSSNGWFFLGCLCLVLAAVLFTLWVLKLENRTRSIRMAGIGLVCIGILSIFLSYASDMHVSNKIEAIIVEEGATLYEASDERSEAIRNISSGIKIRVIDKIGDWNKVQLPDKEVGWLQPDKFEEI